MHLPSPQQGARHESRGENTASSLGTAVTANASANTKGSWSNLGGTTSFAYEGFTLYHARQSANSDALTDIGIDDGGGGISILLPDFHMAGLKQANEHNTQMFVPIHVPAGSQLVARTQATTGSTVTHTTIVGHSKNTGGFPGFSRAIKLFAGGTSRGDAIDPGGSANTKGSWVELVASLSDDIRALCCVIGANGDVSRLATAAGIIDIGVGSAGNEHVVIPDLYSVWGVTWDGPTDEFFQPMACNIAAGSRVVARAQSNITTAGDRAIDLSVWGFV